MYNGMAFWSILEAFVVMVECSNFFSLICLTDLLGLLLHQIYPNFTLFLLVCHKVPFGLHYCCSCKFACCETKLQLVIGYADDHTLLMTILHKNACTTAANNLNTDLSALSDFGHPWNILFAPEKTFSLFLFLVIHPCFWIISVFQKSPQLKLLGLCLILYLPGRSILIVFWVAVNNVWASCSYHCQSLFDCHDVFFHWIHLMLEYGSIFNIFRCSLNRLSSLQTRVENTYGFSIPTLASHRNASILDLIYMPPLKWENMG